MGIEEDLLKKRAEVYNCILAMKTPSGKTIAPVKFEKHPDNDVSERVTSAKADAMLKILKPYLGDAISKVPSTQEYRVVIAHKHLTEEHFSSVVMEKAVTSASLSPTANVDNEIKCLEQLKSLLTLLPDGVKKDHPTLTNSNFAP